MSFSANSPIHRLPEELLLQIAAHLPDSAAPGHLKSFSLASRKFRAAAQEALHTTVKLFISCGCHPKVNPLLKLLRTLFDRSDLALNVKSLRVRTVRKNVAKLCDEHGFDLQSLRARSLAELEVLGCTSSHPWYRTVQNSIESGFAGLLLVLLPNLTHLDFWVKDHHRGPPSSECMSGLFGGMTAPEKVITGWAGLRHLTTSDTHVLKSGIHYDSLTSLDLKTISIGTILRLNGPGCLQGAENLQDLALTVSVQFADRLLIQKAEIQLSDLFEALDCGRLRTLKILMINDGYHIGDDLTTQLDAGYFIDQLDSVKDFLETLEITLEISDDESELEWLLDMLVQPKTSFKHFTAMTKLAIPHAFLIAAPGTWPGTTCWPKDLPPKLESLEILFPHANVEDWIQGFTPREPKEDEAIPKIKELTLVCRDEVGTPASYFAAEVDKIWWVLRTEHGIESYTFCQILESRLSLAQQWYDENGSKADSDESEDEWSDGTDSESTDEEMPDLEDPMDDIMWLIETTD